MFDHHIMVISYLLSTNPNDSNNVFCFLIDILCFKVEGFGDCYHNGDLGITYTYDNLNIMKD